MTEHNTRVSVSFKERTSGEFIAEMAQHPGHIFLVTGINNPKGDLVKGDLEYWDQHTTAFVSSLHEGKLFVDTIELSKLLATGLHVFSEYLKEGGEFRQDGFSIGSRFLPTKEAEPFATFIDDIIDVDFSKIGFTYTRCLFFVEKAPSDIRIQILDKVRMRDVIDEIFNHWFVSTQVTEIRSDDLFRMQDGVIIGIDGTPKNISFDELYLDTFHKVVYQRLENNRFILNLNSLDGDE